MGITLLDSTSSLGLAGAARSGPESWGTPTALLVVVGLHIEARDATDLALQRPAQQGYGLLVFLRGRRWRRRHIPRGRLRGHRGLRGRALRNLRTPCRFDQRPLIQGAALALLLFLFFLGAVSERVLALREERGC